MLFQFSIIHWDLSIVLIGEEFLKKIHDLLRTCVLECLCGMFFMCLFDPFNLWCSFKFRIFLFKFCLEHLFIGNTGILNHQQSLYSEIFIQDIEVFSLWTWVPLFWMQKKISKILLSSWLCVPLFWM